MTQKDPLLLTPLQEKAVNSLLTGKSITAIASELKIGRKTLTRWLKHPIFKGELEIRQRELTRAVNQRIQSLATKSIDKLEALLDSEDPNVVFKTASFFITRIPVQNDRSDEDPNWEKELEREAETIAERELDKDYPDYGGYENYLTLNLKADYQEIMRKKCELEQMYFEQLKKEKLADL